MTQVNGCRHGGLWLGVLAVLAFGIGLAVAQDKPQQKPQDKPAAEPQARQTGASEAKKPTARPQSGEQGQMDPAMQEMMKKIGEYTTPGAAHKDLEPMVGKWTFEVSWWMDPSAPPQKMTGKSENRWMFDGRFVQMEVVGDQPEQDGRLFRGFGLTGYDNLKKKYESIWLDNMGTGIMTTEGTAAQGGKVVNWEGISPDPMTGNPAKKVRAVTRWESDDRHVYEMYTAGPDGKEYKQMEIVYTRAR